MENQEMEKNFDLGTVLSLTTSRMFSELDKIQEALEYVTGGSIWTHQIPRALGQVAPYILSIYPQLEGIGMDEPINSKEEAIAFVNSQKEIFGDSLPLSPMSKTDGYDHVDPLEELDEMRAGRTR